VDAYFGKFAKAEVTNAQALQMFKDQKRIENASQTTLGLGYTLSLVGKCAEAKQKLVLGLGLSRGRIAMWMAGMLAAQCDDVAQAQALMDEMLKKYPEDTAIAGMAVPTIKAQLAINRGQSAEAIQVLEPLRRFDLGLMLGVTAAYLRGLAYLQQKMTNEAATEFQKVIDHRGLDTFSPTHVLAHLGLARTAVAGGDTAKARKSYQDFFALWKDADADLPVLVQAQKEYEPQK
jgi:tetratricopeptide (TPR) repeat protein